MTNRRKSDRRQYNEKLTPWGFQFQGVDGYQKRDSRGRNNRRKK